MFDEATIHRPFFLSGSRKEPGRKNLQEIFGPLRMSLKSVTSPQSGGAASRLPHLFGYVPLPSCSRKREFLDEIRRRPITQRRQLAEQLRFGLSHD